MRAQWRLQATRRRAHAEWVDQYADKRHYDADESPYGYAFTVNVEPCEGFDPEDGYGLFKEVSDHVPDESVLVTFCNEWQIQYGEPTSDTRAYFPESGETVAGLADWHRRAGMARGPAVVQAKRDLERYALADLNLYHYTVEIVPDNDLVFDADTLYTSVTSDGDGFERLAEEIDTLAGDIYGTAKRRVNADMLAMV